MSFAAWKAAKPIGASTRNRPSLSMTQQPKSSDTNNPDGSRSGGSPLGTEFQASNESLSERLARENDCESNNRSNNYQTEAPRNQRVTFSESTALASTLDAAKSNDDSNFSQLSSIEVVSDLFRKTYTMPIFLAMTTAIFLLVHLSGKNDAKSQTLFSPLTELDPSDGARKANVGIGDGFDSNIFSFVPTSSPGEERPSKSEIPTMEVIIHTTPKIDLRMGAVKDYIVVKTTSGGNEKEGEASLKLNFANGVPTSDQTSMVGPSELAGGKTSLPPKVAPKWNVPLGQPTPDPALLDKTSATNMKWNFPKGVPTPDPAYLPKKQSVWKYPPGAPTFNPALIVEIAPKDGSPSTIKWNIPPGEPTPDPAKLPGKSSPTNFGWGYPPGVPTPDPALLNGVPEKLNWGYPPGVPTPDPALLNGIQAEMTWGYPPGVPTPDPAFLLGDSQYPTLRTVETAEPTMAVVELPPKAGEMIVKMPEVPIDPSLPVLPPAPLLIPYPVPITPKNNQIIVLPPPNTNITLESNPVVVKNDVVLQVPPTPQVNTQPYFGTIIRPWRPGNDGRVKPNRPHPGRYYISGGYVVPGGGCNCCNCNGGVPGNLNIGNSMLPMQVPYMQSYDPNALSTNSFGLTTTDAGCPWECVIDETVPTMGRSNEDDAVYEIFYTNPLNCCGTIVEIGAGNGKDNSVSYFFEFGMNWTTILTEADPIDFGLIANERGSDKTTLLNGAFCQEGSHIYFDDTTRLFQTGKAGEYSSEVTSQEFQITESSAKVDCIRLDSDVLYGLDHVNVIVIHVRGDPWAVVRTMNWDITVDIWIILMEEKQGMLHDTLRAALTLHDYVPAAWDIKLWCETPTSCMENEVWLRKSFSALPRPLIESSGLRGAIE